MQWRRGDAHPLAQCVLDMYVWRSLTVALSSLRSSSCKIGPLLTAWAPSPIIQLVQRSLGKVSLHMCHRGEHGIVHLERPRCIYGLQVEHIPSWVKLRGETQSDSSNEDHESVKHWRDGFRSNIGAEGKTTRTLVLISEGIGDCPPTRRTKRGYGVGLRPVDTVLAGNIRCCRGKDNYCKNENMYFLIVGYPVNVPTARHTLAEATQSLANTARLHS